MLTAYEYSQSDGTDGILDDAEPPQPATHAVNKPRKNKRNSRQKHDNSPQAEWSSAVPRNLSADAVSVFSLSEPFITY